MKVKFNLRLRKLIKKSEKEDPIKAAIRQEEREVQAWLAENRELDTSALVLDWKKQTLKTSESLVSLMLRAYAFADGVVKANDTMRHGFKIDEGIDLKDSTELIGKLFKIELANLYINSSACTESQKSAIVDKIISREFPLKDNLPNPPKHVAIPRTSGAALGANGTSRPKAKNAPVAYFGDTSR